MLSDCCPADATLCPNEFILVEETVTNMDSSPTTSDSATRSPVQYSLTVSAHASPQVTPQVTPLPFSDPGVKVVVGTTTQVTPQTTLHPVSDHDASPGSSPYPMNRESRGIAVIFNHEKFNDPLLSEREGTEADAKSLEVAFKQLGFDPTNIHRHNDLTVKAMQELIVRYARKTDYSNMDCFMGAILTHGEENGVIHGYASRNYRL